MPDGKTHAAITSLAAGTIAVVMWKTGFTPEEISLATRGCMAGTILSPDLDVDAGFLGHAMVETYFGPIVGKVWRAFWLPYALFFPHRGNGSHIPVISTAGRVIYVYGMYFAVCVDFGFRAWVPSWHTAFYMFAGLVVSDTLHFLADIISTYLKTRRHRGIFQFPMSEMRRTRRPRA